MMPGIIRGTVRKMPVCLRNEKTGGMDGFTDMTLDMIFRMEEDLKESGKKRAASMPRSLFIRDGKRRR